MWNYYRRMQRQHTKNQHEKLPLSQAKTTVENMTYKHMHINVLTQIFSLGETIHILVVMVRDKRNLKFTLDIIQTFLYKIYSSSHNVNKFAYYTASLHTFFNHNKSSLDFSCQSQNWALLYYCLTGCKHILLLAIYFLNQVNELKFGIHIIPSRLWMKIPEVKFFTTNELLLMAASSY